MTDLVLALFDLRRNKPATIRTIATIAMPPTNSSNVRMENPNIVEGGVATFEGEVTV